MKKIIFSFLILLFSVSVFGQYVPAYNFNGYVNVKKSIYVYDTVNAQYMLVDSLVGEKVYADTSVAPVGYFTAIYNTTLATNDVYADSIVTTEIYADTVASPNGYITTLYNTTLATNDVIAQKVDLDTLYFSDSTYMVSAASGGGDSLYSATRIALAAPKITFGRGGTEATKWAVLDSATGNFFISNKGYGALGPLTGANNIVIGNGAGWYMTGGTTQNNVYIGASAGSFAYDQAQANVGIGYAALSNANYTSNVGIGERAGLQVSTGGYNTLVGATAGYAITTGSYNIRIGASCGWNAIGGAEAAGISNSIYIGANAGSYQTQDRRFIVSNAIVHTSQAEDSLNSLIYSIMDPLSTANQLNRFNSQVYVKHQFYALDDVNIPALKDTMDQVLYIDTAGKVSAFPIFPTDITLGDDSSYVFPEGISGRGWIAIDSVGEIHQWADFYFNADGTVGLIANSTDVATTDTDNKVCIYDVGSGFAIKNRLGYAVILKQSILK